MLIVHLRAFYTRAILFIWVCMSARVALRLIRLMYTCLLYAKQHALLIYSPQGGSIARRSRTTSFGVRCPRDVQCVEDSIVFGCHVQKFNGHFLSLYLALWYVVRGGDTRMICDLWHTVELFEVLMVVDMICSNNCKHVVKKFFWGRKEYSICNKRVCGCWR